MTQKKVFLAAILLLLSAGMCGGAAEKNEMQAFAGQDLHMSGTDLLNYQPEPGKSILVFNGNFSMYIGDNSFSSDSAVVWLESIKSEYYGRTSIEYYTQVYLEGNVSVKKGKTAATTNISSSLMSGGRALVVRFNVTGEVFATAETRKVGEPNKLEIYKRAQEALRPVKYEPFVNPEAALPAEKKPEIPQAKPPTGEQPRAAEQPVTKKPSLIEEFFMPSTTALKPAPAEKKPAFQYPVNISPATDVKPKIESAVITPEGISAATVIGRFYVWQKLNEHGGLLELQADNAVIFYNEQQFSIKEPNQNKKDNILAAGAIKAIYLSGNVVMAEGTRTIRADEIYYDFDKHAGMAVNAVMRSFDENRNIPIYVRASKLRQLSQTKFEGDNITLTNSEFYVPQLSLQASRIVITDSTAVDEQFKQMGDNVYTADLRDVRVKLGETSLLYFPRMQVNSSGLDVPIKSINIGYDNAFGFGVETKWYLSRLIGLKQPEGTDSTLRADYYGKRGEGAGIDVDYKREKYFGDIRSYIIHDQGEDRLGRIREHTPFPESTRGRFKWQHRQFLQDHWQLTLETSYLSDRNYLEQYERREFTTGKEQETLLHLKRIQDNWGLSILAKWRINNFQDQLEELPTIEYHRTGESVFDNRFTFYSDTQLSNLRQRIGIEEPIDVSTKSFTFATSRNELDLPLSLGTWKFVPYVAGTAAYDDRSGFNRSFAIGQDSEPGDYTAGVGEIGARFSTQYWTVYPEAQSRLFDVNEIRHLIKPYFVTAAYEATDDVLQDEERNTAKIGMLQRWQTKRGPNQQTVDWIRLDTSATFVNNEDEQPSGPNQFIWNRPLVPLRVLAAPGIYNGDLSIANPSLVRFENWGPRRNTFDGDYIWRVTDTLAILSDIDYDIKAGEVQQFDIGYSHLVYPHLSYYLGSRYLPNTQVLRQHGSNVFTAAVTYIIDPRYTITFAQQYDFDYEASLRSEITVLRRYHRIYYGFSVSADQSLDSQAIMFSIWPEGVPELSLGSRYEALTSITGNE